MIQEREDVVDEDLDGILETGEEIQYDIEEESDRESFCSIFKKRS